MKKIFQRLFFVFFLSAIGVQLVQASHIVGGQLGYKFVSRNGNLATYNITLRMYKDCASQANGQNSPFPTTIIMHSYVGNSTTRLALYTLRLKASSIASVAPPNYPCLTIPPYVCVQQADYYLDTVAQATTIVLRDTNQTYRFVGRACCRNMLIGNILGASTAGAIYFAELTPEGLRGNNNSPDFTLFPPTVVCQGEPLNFNHSANDNDSDDLVYEFCNSPNTGTGTGCTGTSGAPCNGPFTSVSYKPGFTGPDPFGSNANPRVRINAQTGVITGTPQAQGNYVVGVCVKEYRNGVLIGTIFRDFQFNVESCRRNIVPAITGDSIGVKQFIVRACDSTTITFFNQSTTRANIFSTLWRFDIRGVIQEFSTWDATVSFRDTGFYQGKMYLNPGTACGDSADVNVRIGAVGVKPDASFRYDTCNAGPVAFRNLTPAHPDIVRYVWNYNDATRLDSNKVAPNHLFATPGNKNVLLRVFDKYGCKADTVLQFGWNPAPAILIIEPDSYVGCAPGKVKFKNRSVPVDSTYNVTWNFGDGTTARSIDAEHVYPNAGNYTVAVRVVSPIGCTKSATYPEWIRVEPNPKAGFEFSPKNATNIESLVNFKDSSSADVTGWRWFFPKGYGFSTDKNPSVIFNRDTGWLNVRMRVVNQYGCADSASKMVYIRPEVRFFMPNAFTPNHDSNNERFRGNGFTFGMKSFNLKVYARWGEKIFETNDIEEGWDGTKNNTGIPLPAGIYLYQLRYVTPLNEIVEKQEYFTLFR